MSGNETNNQTRAVLIPPAYARQPAKSAPVLRGGRSVDLMNYSNDFDIYTGWADAVTGRDFSQVADLEATLEMADLVGTDLKIYAQ